MLRPVYILPVVFLAFLSGAVVVVKAHRATPQAAPATAASAPANAREAWAIDLLARLGNPAPTAETVAMVVEWTLAEDAGMGAFERNNPLNTTQSGFAETHTINGDGVRGYASYEDGMQATLQTLSYGYYTGIVAALQSNDPEAAKQALWASPWAGSHYGYGAAWPAYQAEAQQPAAAPACPVDPCWQSGKGYSSGHPGIDLGAEMGQPVYAVMDGVADVSETWPCGVGVLVTAGETQTLYCHLSAPAVADGSLARAGDVIGYAGSTGLSIGPHVHFELRQDGTNVDPSGVLR